MKRILIIAAGLIVNTIILYLFIAIPLSEGQIFQLVSTTALAIVALTLFAPEFVRTWRFRLLVMGIALLFSQIAMLDIGRQLLAMPEWMLPLLLNAIYLLIAGSAFIAYRLYPDHENRWARYKKHLRLIVLASSAIVLNFVLVHAFNTLMWPYMWPRPMLFYVIGIIVVLLWFPEITRSIWMLRIVGMAMLFVGQCYLFHSISVFASSPSILSLMHLIGFSGMYMVVILNFINQSSPENKKAALPLDLANIPYVTVIVPTYGEPLRVLENTLTSLKHLRYPADRLQLIISDDAHRKDLQELAQRMGIIYNFGSQRDAKAGNLNSALQYIREYFPQTQLILTQDADEIIHPEFLMKTVGYFQQNPRLGIVQTPKEAYAPKNDPFGTRDRIFYDITQVGRNGRGSAFACGSAVLWNIDAVTEVGGFSTWNVVEDLTTSYLIHAAGYASEYHNEVLSIGLAPEDIPGLLKQRGTWAVDNWRLFLFDNSLFKKGLSWLQRLQYFELGMFHVATSFFTPLVMIVPIISILTDDYLPIEGSALFPWVAFSFIYYIVLSNGRVMDLIRMWQFWVGHGPTFIQAFLIAVRSRDHKPGYIVTRKTRQDGFYGYLLWMQFLYLGLVALAITHIVVSPPDVSTEILLSNVGSMLFFAFMVGAICRASFYKVSFGFLSGQKSLTSANYVAERS